MIWEVTSCADGRRLYVEIWNQDSDIEAVQAIETFRRQREAWVLAGMEMSQDTILTLMSANGHFVDWGNDPEFEARCALRGTGQLGGSFN